MSPQKHVMLREILKKKKKQKTNHTYIQNTQLTDKQNIGIELFQFIPFLFGSSSSFVIVMPLLPRRHIKNKKITVTEEENLLRIS